MRRVLHLLVAGALRRQDVELLQKQVRFLYKASKDKAASSSPSSSDNSSDDPDETARKHKLQRQMMESAVQVEVRDRVGLQLSVSIVNLTMSITSSRQPRG